MPAIYLFNRRSFIGGDDLQPAVYLALLLRLVQLTLFLGPIFVSLVQESRRQGGILSYMFFDHNQYDDSCRHSHMFGLLLMSYAIGSACYSVGSALLEWRISYWAGIGSPTETQPRSTKISYLLELKLIPFPIVLFLIFCAGLTSIAYAPHYYRCNAKTDDEHLEMHFRDHIKLWWITAFMLASTQLSETLVSWLYLVHHCSQPPRANYFLSADTEHALDEEDYVAVRHELIEEMWAKRCQSACQCLGVASCFMFGGREVMGQGDFSDISRALADYLETRGVLDVVPSDIAAGFLVLQKLQRLRVQKSRKEIVRTLSQRLPEPRLAEDEENLISSDPLSGLETPNNNNLAVAPGESLQFLESGGAKTSARNSLISNSEDGLLVPLGGGIEPINAANLHEGRNSRQSSLRYISDGDSQEPEMQGIFCRDNIVDMTTLEEGARYAKYALAIYTWVLYLYVHPVTGIPRLASKGCFTCCCGANERKSSPHLENLSPHVLSQVLDRQGRFDGDGICESHKNALLLTAGLQEADLVYLQLKNGFRHNPYCILLDHQWKCVVVSIRGTFSLEDCVTDVLIEPESLAEMGRQHGFDAENQHCHGGVLMWVRNIYRDLQTHRLLETLLLGDNAEFPDYTLRLVGHSLGATTCTILSYMLRPKFPTLRCVNYSPPGCSLSWDLAVGCKDWCSSFVLDSDIVPRLSFDSMSTWRDEILEVIGRIKVPKSEVVRRFLRKSPSKTSCEVDPPLLEDINESYRDIKDILHDPEDVPDSEYQRQLQRFKYIHEERRRARGNLREIKLYPPGKMVHLVKTGEKRQCMHGLVKCLTCFTTNIGFEYTPIWINNGDLDEIIISAQMGTDHFPNRMLNVVNDVAAKYGLNST